MTRAGTALLAAHALFKATLFLVVGAVDHATGTRDLRRLDGLGRRMPLLAAVAALAAASMAGIPPLLGFVAKEYGFESLVDHVEDGWALPVLVGLVAGSVLTVAYTARFLWGAFASKSARRLRDPVDLGAAHAPGALLLGPPLLLAVLSLGAGIVPGVSTRPLVDAALALDRAVDDHTLELWHGITVPLLLSVLAVGLGALLFAGAERIEAVVARLPLLPNAGQAFNALIDRVVRGAGRLTGVVQNGSLPVYLGVILLTAVVLPTAAVLPDAALPEDLVVAESALQLAAAAAVVVVSVATVLSRQRFHAVLGLGATGYAVAVLFMVQGAPDLALTQLLIETLSVVLFVLVLRHLPRRFAVISWRGAQTLRLVVAVTVGATVAVGTLVMAAARRSPSVSEGFLERALPEGGGRNVVNVILVDFRGYDTLGEITVLTVAALGIVALVRAGRGARGSGGGER